MLRQIMALCRKHRDILLYLIFGALTTVVSIGCFALLRGFWPESRTVVPNTIALTISVLFAYLTNRTFVFRSKTAGAELAREMAAFFGARALSSLLNIAIVFAAVDLLHLNDFASKAFADALVILLNYLFSKFWIFKQTH